MLNLLQIHLDTEPITKLFPSVRNETTTSGKAAKVTNHQTKTPMYSVTVDSNAVTLLIKIKKA